MSKQLVKHSLASKVNKNLPKLKCILGQPFPRYCPKISGNDVQDLKNLIEDDMKEKKLDKATYLKKTGTRIGLKSCLRVISSNEVFFCALISADIKPKFVIQQIIHMVAARNNKNTTAFCVPTLGQILKDLFGVSSLALILGSEISPSIKEWIRTRMHSAPVPLRLQQYHRFADRKLAVVEEQKKVCVNQEEIDLNKIYLPKTDSKRTFVPQVVRESADIKLIEEKNIQKSGWTGDFLPFSKNDQEVDILERSYISELSKIASNSAVENNIHTKTSNFCKYVRMKVHKIKGNPEKLKKRRK